AKFLELPPAARYGAAFALWSWTFACTGCDRVYFIVSVMVFIFGPGLARDSSGQYSAYSVFNKGQRHLLGELRAEQLDAEQRGNQSLAGYGQSEDGGLIQLPGADEDE
ncbi:hmu, partial [Symbiodinium necroappetens]